MSRYLQDLVSRNVGDGRGLTPRPRTQYETAKQSAAAEVTEFTQARVAGNASLASHQLRLGITSRELPENYGPHITDVIGHGLQRNSGREQHHLEGTGGNDEGSDGTPHAHNFTDQDSTASARTSDNRSTIRRGNGKDRLSEVGDTVRSDSASSNLKKTRATVPAFRQEAKLKTNSLAPPGIEQGVQGMPQQEIVRQSFRPTMKEGSMQHVQSRATGQPSGAQPPIVQIRIGRIEVRAVAPPAPALNKKNVEPLRSSMPLDQYLGRRS